MTIGLFGLVWAPVILLHQLYLRSADRLDRKVHNARENPALVSAVLAMLLALLIALPWHVWSYLRYGMPFLNALLAPPDMVGPAEPGLSKTLLSLAPVTLPLAALACVRMLFASVQEGAPSRALSGSVFWIGWIGITSLLPTCWTAGPHSAFNLLLLVPLNLLAAQAIIDLAIRQIHVRSLIWLIPAAALTFALSASPGLRTALKSVAADQQLKPAELLRLHLCLDVVLIPALLVYAFMRWSRHHDHRRRFLLGGFLSLVIAITTVTGIREVRFQHRETKDLLTLREVVLRLHRERPFTLIAVVGPPAVSPPLQGPQPGGRLRFILRTALPDVSQIDLARVDQLANLPPGQCLVILLGQEQLPYALQARLALVAIHPGRSGVLDAFATIRQYQDIRRR
jgi:hypothetical protein